MPPQSRKEELAIQRQEAGLGYKVGLWLTMFAGVLGGVVSMAAFHAPHPINLGSLELLVYFPVFLIYGGPGFVPFFALFLILWYNPPRKKGQEGPPTTSGGPAG